MQWHGSGTDLLPRFCCILVDTLAVLHTLSLQPTDAALHASAEGGGGVPLLPEASFASLPGRKVLTLNMDVPESWLVEAVEAEVRCRPNMQSPHAA